MKEYLVKTEWVGKKEKSLEAIKCRHCLYFNLSGTLNGLGYCSEYEKVVKADAQHDCYDFRPLT
jgi:hypothetical protein